jgi:predicted enzyme related to lactoylglutathione lyase
MADQLVTGVDFTPIPSQDIARSVDFYESVLGLPRAVYMPERNFAEFEPGDVTINIYNPVAMGIAEEHQPNPQPLALHVDDVQTARAELESRGVEFLGDTFDTGVCHMAFFRDPDGNPLMLHHRYAPRVTEN